MRNVLPIMLCIATGAVARFPSFGNLDALNEPTEVNGRILKHT